MRFDIPDSELQWSFDTSGGPGGQHANRSNTRVQLSFDVATSIAFDDDTRRRIIAGIGDQLTVVESGSRSQTRNRHEALRRLMRVLEDAADTPPPHRRRTRPSRAASERRLESKRRRGSVKRARRPPAADE